MVEVRKTTFRIRRDTAANWTADNPVLNSGEPAIETDTRKVKYGDGSTAWNSLAYSSSPYDSTDVDITGGVISDLDGLGVGVTAPAQGIETSSSAFNPFANGDAALVVGGAYGGGILIKDSTGRLGFWGQDGGATLHFGIGSSSGLTSIMNLTTAGLQPSTDNTRALGDASYRWSVVYSATGTINTSDARLKRNIGPIPDDWLDAWSEVEWTRYKFRSGTRWHVGLVAQRVRDAFALYGIDALEIGLLCFDPTDTGGRWGLRYDECQAIESAWQRRSLQRIADHLGIKL